MEKVIGIISANYTTGEMKGMTRSRTIASLPFGSMYRMIDFALSSMVNSGITSVGVIIPMHCRSLLDHIGFGKNWNLDRKVGGLFFLPEAAQRVNRAARHFLLQDMILNQEFLTRSQAPYAVFSNCHFVYNLDYRPVLEKIRESNADIVLLCSKKVRNDWNCRGVRLDEKGQVVRFAEEQEGEDLLFMDSFVIRRELLLSLVEEYDENIFDLIEQNLNVWKVQTYVHAGYVGSITTAEDYFRCNQDLLRENAVREELFCSPHSTMTKVHDNAPTRVYPSAYVRNCMLGSGGEIHGTVENSILFRGVVVGEGAVIRNSIVMPSAVIGRKAKIENAIVDKRSIVDDEAVIRGTEQNPIISGKYYNLL